MQFRKSALGIMAISSIVLSACNIGATPAPTIDVNAISTAAVETALAAVAQQQTLTAQAASPTAQPTNTQQPTNTPFATLAVSTPLGGGTPLATIGIATPISTLSGPQCHDAIWISDLTVPDGSEMDPGQDFVKAWAVMNTGTCDWDEGYALVPATGDVGALDGYAVVIENSGEFVEPGETTEFEVELTAPLAEREYIGCWRMQTDTGYFFGGFVCVTIVVSKN